MSKKSIIVFTTVLGISLVFLGVTSTKAAIKANLWTDGIVAPDYWWSCGFSINSTMDQFARVYYALEVGGEFFYFANNGFDVTNERLPYGDIFLYENQEVNVTLYNFVWPGADEVDYSEFLHFWFWLWVEASSGQEIKNLTKGYTIFRDGLPYFTPLPTFTPTQTPTPTRTPSPSSTPTPTMTAAPWMR